MTRAAVLFLIVLCVLAGLSTHMVVNCGDEDDPDICSAVIGFSPLRGSLIAFAYEGRGRIALRHGDFKRAIADFDEAIHLNPNRGSLYRRAILSYSTAVRLDPSDAQARLDRGLAFLARGQADDARADFEAALALPAGKESGMRDLARAKLAELASAEPTQVATPRR